MMGGWEERREGVVWKDFEWERRMVDTLEKEREVDDRDMVVRRAGEIRSDKDITIISNQIT